MTEVQGDIVFCPHCGEKIENNRYIRRTDGTYRCEHCYFSGSCIEGMVDEIETRYLVTLEAFVSAIDAREHEVGNHSLRVMQFAVVIGHFYGISGRDLVDLYCGSLLHDIGKIGIPDAILLKKGPLTSEEEAIMRGHPLIGYRIISHIGYFARAAEIIMTHHEHFDGSGYPRGLKGQEIPLGARVFAVADALDALTVNRPYREALSYEDAQRAILTASGKNFDPAVLEAFVNTTDKIKSCTGIIAI